MRALRAAHPHVEGAAFFSGGFVFDVLTLDRIDSPAAIAQQTAFLLALGGMLLYAERYELGLARPQGLVAKAWNFSEDAIHYLLGALLSAFSLLYFKSASGVTPLFFLAVVFALLVANELPRFRAMGHVVRVSLLGFCAFSFFSYMVPTIVGFLSVWLMIAAMVLSLGVGALLFWRVDRWGGREYAIRRIAVPYAGVHAVILVLYAARAIPPLPVYTQAMGIYHEVHREKTESGTRYRLLHQRRGWKFWHTGDQDFLARPGDKAYMFVRVWAPAGFADAVQVRWARKDPERGWVEHKPLPLAFTGGREQGFRTFAYTSDPKPGAWRVDIETGDGRVIGRKSFEVEADPSVEPRVFREDEG